MMTICKMVMIKYIPVIEWIMLYFEILHLNLIFQIHYWDLFTETSLIMNMSFLIRFRFRNMRQISEVS